MKNRLKFSDMKYERPDFDDAQKKLNDIMERVKGAESYDEIRKCIFEYEDTLKAVYEQCYIAMIRRYHDCRDEYYKKESEYCDAHSVAMDCSGIQRALLESPYREDINKEFGCEYLASVEADIKVHAGGKDLQAKDIELTSKYQQIKSELVFELDGKKLNEGEITKCLQNPDRELRKRACAARNKGYLAHEKEFVQILDDMIENRISLAKANGFDSYLDYMNVEKGRRGYGEKELNAFCGEVKRVIVPFLRKAYAKQAERIGVDKITPYDSAFYFPDGNAEPAADAKGLLKIASRMYHGLSEDMGLFYDDMVDREFIDSIGSPYKINGMGFMTELPKSGSTFIFANANGTSSDVDTVTHEVGHAYQFNLSMKEHKLMEYYGGCNDCVEIPSMTMEFFSYPYAEDFFGDGAEKFRLSHMQGVLERICWFCMTNELENYLYLNPKASMKDRVSEFERLQKDYYPDYDDSMFKADNDRGAGIFKLMAVYMFPKYVISYALSEVGAMSFMQRFCEDRNEALESYKKFCMAGGSLPYPELMKIAGLDLAYAPGAIEKAAQFIMKRI